jgi:iron complex outermembrane recepter protein
MPFWACCRTLLVRLASRAVRFRSPSISGHAKIWLRSRLCKTIATRWRHGTAWIIGATLSNLAFAEEGAPPPETADQAEEADRPSGTTSTGAADESQETAGNVEEPAQSAPLPAEPPESPAEGGEPSAGQENRVEPSQGGRIVLPVVQVVVEPTYPSSEQLQPREVEVELLVTVLTDGSVGAAEISLSGGAAFDRAALAAIRKWRFSPATRDGDPVKSRVRVPILFFPPAPPSAHVHVAPAETEKIPEEVTVTGERPAVEGRAASDFRIDRDVIAAAPRAEGAEVLRSAPGLYIGRGEGMSVAHSYMLRGFDAEHGQDIEFRVGGLPINLPSHIHGQGYADLGFLIGDVVSELEVQEGVSDPRQGDFAVAGSIRVGLGVKKADRGLRFRSGYGSFNTFRQLAVFAPREASQETFGAAEYQTTSGFGQNRAGQSANLLYQHRFGGGELSFRTIGIARISRSRLAGVLRQDDVLSGELCFECVYPYPTAEAQNAASARVLAGVFVDYASEKGAEGQFGLWLGHDAFRIQENFTGFIQESRTLARVAGRGDLIEQVNGTSSLGLTGRFRSEPYAWHKAIKSVVEVGADARTDSIDQTQNLLDGTRNQTWDTRVDASILGADLGMWGDIDSRLSKHVRFRFGVRSDVLFYSTDDRLGNFAPIVRPQDSFVPGFRRSAMGMALGPRTNIEVMPTNWLSLLAAYGEGYRSPQARILEDGEPAPFSKVRSLDIGLRIHREQSLKLTAAGYYTHLSDDVAFDASEGRLERIGATERLGAVFQAVARPTDWLVASGSFTAARAILLEPPAATADEPDPPFTEGQQLPFVPPVVVRVDIGVRRTLVTSLAGQKLGARAGLGFSFLSPRPLPYGATANPVSVLDASAVLSWGALDLGFEIFNMFDSRYAALEYSFPSDWDPADGYRSRVPARHTSAGAPLSWMVSLGVTL